MSNISTVDLFCGAGGFTEGFKKASGFETILAIDFDKQAIDTFKHNHPSVRTICQDVVAIDDKKLNDLINNREVDVVIGGPPCQGFSLAGPRLPDDPKNRLFKEFVRIVDVLKPKVFVFENVSGIVSMQRGLVLEAICTEFTKIGYTVSHGILNSAQFGVPQARPRFIMIGTSSGKCMTMPSPTHDYPQNCNPDLFGYVRSPFITVKEALSNLPRIEQGQGDEILDNTPPRNEYQKRVFGNRRPGILYNHRATRHSQKIIDRYLAIPQGGDIRSLPPELRTRKNNIFRLLDTTPSRTITCNFRTDILHPWQPRGLTTREAARLQSFDDDYQFFGNLTRKARYVTQDDQVGNAVPPLLAMALAKHIKEIL
ncbi:MAG: DNA cytosine methyltransferase [Symploca sp. SIO2C1]|nr:DNA cytosine methyltransferase [Symploca sp. SIO2C1]